MAISLIVARQILKRTSGGRIHHPNRAQALMRLPTLMRIGYVLFRDARVPLWQRATVVGLIGLIFSPLDIMGDIPVVGQFWNFTLAITVLDWFILLAPADVVNEHIVALGLEKKIPLRRA